MAEAMRRASSRCAPNMSRRVTVSRRPRSVAGSGLLVMSVMSVISVISVVASACGVPIEQSAEPISADDLPVGLRPTDSTIPAALADQEPIDIWLVRDDRLAATRHRVDPPVTPQVALAELLSGPSEAEQNRSLRSAIPDAEVVLAVEVLRGVAIVDLAPTFSEIPASDQVLAVGQIVMTLTDLRGVGRVRFVVDEVDIAVPLPTGDASEGGVSRDDYLDLTDTAV